MTTLVDLESALKADPDNKRLAAALDEVRKALVLPVEGEATGRPWVVMSRDSLDVEVDGVCRVNNGFETKNARVLQLATINNVRAWKVRVDGQEFMVRHPDEAWAP